MVTLPFKPLPGGEECFLRVAFTLPEKAAWAKAGFEVASQQLAAAGADRGRGHVQREAAQIDPHRGADHGCRRRFHGRLRRSEGTIAKLERDGRNILAAGGGPKLHLWRRRTATTTCGPTTNGCGTGSTTSMQTVQLAPTEAGPTRCA